LTEKNGWPAKNQSWKIKILNPKNGGLEDDVPFIIKLILRFQPFIFQGVVGVCNTQGPREGKEAIFSRFIGLNWEKKAASLGTQRGLY